MKAAPGIVIGVLAAVAFAATFAWGRAGAETESAHFGTGPQELAVSDASPSTGRLGRAVPLPSLRSRRAKQSSDGAGGSASQRPKQSGSDASNSGSAAPNSGSADPNSGSDAPSSSGPTTGAAPPSEGGTKGEGSTGGGGAGGGGGGGSDSAPSGPTTTILDE